MATRRASTAIAPRLTRPLPSYRVSTSRPAAAQGAYMGKGVSKAVENIIKVIAPALIGMDPAAQQAIDDKMVQARRTASHHTTPHRAAPHRTAPGMERLAARGPRQACRPAAQELDGSKNEWGWSKSKLGANAILAVSMAACKAGAPSYTELPRPCTPAAPGCTPAAPGCTRLHPGRRGQAPP